MINDQLLNRVTAKVLERLENPRIQLEASGRHVHLSREDVETLFGKGHELTRVSDLSQPGQFVCKERIRVVGPKGEFPSVVILGPERAQAQVEISLTDTVTLGIRPPVRLSGHTEATPGAQLVGPAGAVDIPHGVIVAQRHIHMVDHEAKLYGLKDGQIVSVLVEGDRGVTFHNVVIRASANFATYMHIDYDEANACGFQKGMHGIILTE